MTLTKMFSNFWKSLFYQTAKTTFVNFSRVTPRQARREWTLVKDFHP